MWATGYNNYGQLGDFSRIDSDSLVQVISIGAKAVTAGAFHSMALMRDGTARAAGSNHFGQFGVKLKDFERSFVRVEEIGMVYYVCI